MISVHEAKTIVQRSSRPIGTGNEPLEKVSSRILAQDVRATFPMPRFDNSAMDGFAVRAEDTIGATQKMPKKLEIRGISSAGNPYKGFIQPGQCVQCMTGAVIPEGADAIVIVENTSGFKSNNNVDIYRQASSGENIRFAGEEINRGKVLIVKGARIGPAEIGTLANFGYKEVLVAKRPRIALFATGDELVAPGESLEEGEIYNSNLPVISDLVELAGAEVVMQHVVADDRSAILSFLVKALERCDIVVSTGGISMGRFDFLKDVLEEIGVIQHFWKVAQKPGKPLFFGTKGDKLVFGLPGNPVSAFIGFMEYVWLAIEQIMGTESELLKAKLATPFPRDPHKYRFLLGTVWVDNEALWCKPSPKTGSHMLSSALEANCIIGVEPGDGKLSVDSFVTFRLLPWLTIKGKSS